MPPTLHAFLEDNLEELLRRIGERSLRRELPGRGSTYSAEGLRTLFARLVRKLKSAPAVDPEAPTSEAISVAEGAQLSSISLTIGQVIRGYGDISRAVTELALERNVGISVAEFQTFNAFLDDAVATAATAYSRARDSLQAAAGAERVGELVHELRNVLGVAMLSFDIIKRGAAGMHGSVSNSHTRSLTRLNNLVDRAFSAVRLEASVLQLEQVSVAELLEDTQVASQFQAKAHNLELFVASPEADVLVKVDRQMLAGALSNLLQNAFKFSRPNSLVSLSVQVTLARVLIEVQDECGGLPGGKTEELFLPFAQNGSDRLGLGLGLGIARKAVEANGGELHVLDLPQLGCRFTIDLPRAFPQG